MMNEAGARSPIAVEGLSFTYGSKPVFSDVTFSVPEGAIYALVGPNGAGKTTLMQVLISVLRRYRGHARVLGQECADLSVGIRQLIGYVAEGQKLPSWMTLEQLLAYLAPLYPTWDRDLVETMLNQLDLDRKSKIGKMSRGQYMKSSLLCALAFRPRLLVLDEPFTGIDVGVKDAVIRAVLGASTGDGCTIVLSSHDISELELLADWIGFLGTRSMRLSMSVNEMKQRFRHVDVVLASDHPVANLLDTNWQAVEQSGNHLRFIASDASDAIEQTVRATFPDAMRIEAREATLKEVFLASQRADRDLK
jgi:ABC-2 type transport system ATP-binding protein